MKKARKQQYKKIIPFVITAVASVSLSSALFLVFATSHFNQLARAALSAATADVFQGEIPEGVAPFYKTKSFSKDAPRDADVVGMPTLTLRDRVLLTESSGEVKVSLYKKDESQSGPYFSYTIGNGNEQSYIAGEYGVGEFVIVTTRTSDCWAQPLGVCTSYADKIAEWHYAVVADTFTYSMAPLDKRDVALRNAHKDDNEEVAEPEAESEPEEHESIVETIVDTVTELFGGGDDATGENGQADTSESETTEGEQGGFQIIPSEESDAADESSVTGEAEGESTVESSSESSAESASADSGASSEGGNE